MGRIANFRVDQLHVSIFATRAEMGTAAGENAAQEIARVIQRNGAARVILASAPSQDELLERLVDARLRWSSVTLFHMDEYVGLSADHPATFRSYQHDHVLARIEPASFHGIAGEAPDLAAECERYTALLDEAPIDVVCLGIGENGHIAFNDPPVADFADPLAIKVVDLDETCRQQQVNDRCFPRLEAVPRQAITLTVPTLLKARALFCAVPGSRKAPAVRATLQAPISTACPASVLRRHPNAHLYLDQASAALIDHSSRAPDPMATG
jgi:glucosamine-6-phosphate deaminase